MPHPLEGRPILRMNGIGNEILVLDLRDLGHEIAPQEARAIADTPGLRFDQLMVLHPPRTKGADAFMRIFNRDGSLSSACGNGARCVAYALARAGGGDESRLETEAGLLQTRREAETLFTVDVGAPRLDREPARRLREDAAAAPARRAGKAAATARALDHSA